MIYGLIIVLFAAVVFTNSIEWLGKKLNLGEGAVGSLLAAVGTALPETIIPLVAFFFGSGVKGEAIGIGAILGAPFMLSTLAFFMTGFAALFRKEAMYRRELQVDLEITVRDLSFFLIVYSIAVGSAFLFPLGKKISACIIVFLYTLYVWKTVKQGKKAGGPHNLGPLWFAPRSDEPPLLIVIFQLIAALIMLLIGAHVFVEEIQQLAVCWAVPAFILSLVITPVATELPEKFNTVFWIAKRKDALALGNITGAMVFQSSLVPAVGMFLTKWVLNPVAIVNISITFLSTGSLLLGVLSSKSVKPWMLIQGGLFYLAFIMFLMYVYK